MCTTNQCAMAARGTNPIFSPFGETYHIIITTLAIRYLRRAPPWLALLFHFKKSVRPQRLYVISGLERQDKITCWLLIIFFPVSIFFPCLSSWRNGDESCFVNHSPHGQLYWLTTVSSNNTQYGKQCITTSKIKRRETKFFQDIWQSFERRKKVSGDNIWHQKKTFHSFSKKEKRLFQAFPALFNTFRSVLAKVNHQTVIRSSLNHCYSHVKVCLGMQWNFYQKYVLTGFRRLLYSSHQRGTKPRCSWLLKSPSDVH